MLKPLCVKRLIFKRVRTLTKDCTFSANSKLYKQIDGCTNVWSNICSNGQYRSCVNLRKMLYPLILQYFTNAM